MRQLNIDARIALAATVLTLAASLFVAALGYILEGFLLFIVAATPLPGIIAMRANRWLRAYSVGQAERTAFTGKTPALLHAPRRRQTYS